MTFQSSFQDSLSGAQPTTKAGWTGKVIGASIARILIGAQYALGAAIVLKLLDIA
jgi:hypothetical protein